MTGSTYEHPAARTPPPRRPLHDVRAAARLAQARPAYAAGWRAGLATVVPLLVDHALGTGGGTWMSLAGLNGALIDRGGPYRTRAVVLTAAALVSATAVLLGTLLAGHPALAIPATFAVATVCGLMRVWPDVGPGFGVTTLVTYAIALALPAPTFLAAVMRAVFIAIGGLWAMLIAIVVWPLRPYRPVRLSVAACYRAIANYLDDAIVESSSGAPRDPWAFKAHLVVVREALEGARAALATTRRGRSAESRRGERLLILHELADQLYAHVIALAEIVEGARGASISLAVRQDLSGAAQRAAAMLRGLARGIESERDLPRLAADWSGEPLRAPSTEAPNGGVDPNRVQIAELLDRIAEYANTAAAFAATLSSGDPVPDVDERTALDASPRRDMVLLSVSALMRPDSVVLQHALRVGVVTAVAVLVTTLLRLNHGYWVTLTAVVIMQPYGAATRQKAFQRVAGTIVGAAVAAALSAAFGGTGAVIVLIFIFTVLCVALLPVNYGAYAIFGTPAFVLLAETSAGNWHLAGLRVTNTLIGGTLALAGSRLLWPVDEWNRLPQHAAAAIRANASFLREAVRVARGGGSRAFGTLRDVRRTIALAATNAEDSFQRLLGEHAGRSEELESIMACLVYTRRLAAAIAGLALAGDPDAQGVGSNVDRFVDAMVPVLDDIADAIENGRAPAPLADSRPEISASSSPLEARMRRITRQVKLLHDAVDRWMSSDIVPHRARR